MNAADWGTLIASATAFITAVTALIIAVGHILHHDPNGPSLINQSPGKPPGKPPA